MQKVETSAPWRAPGQGAALSGPAAAHAAGSWQLKMNPFRKAAYWAFMVLIILKFSWLHEYLAVRMGLDTRLVVIFTVTSLVMSLMAGVLGRLFVLPFAKWWGVFGLWVLLATPFSIWVGGSLAFIMTYLRTAYVMFFLSASAIDLRDVRRLLLGAGFGVLLFTLIASSIATAAAGRMELDFGSLKNSGDLAAFLMITLPLLIFLAWDVKNWLVKIIAILAICNNLSLVFSTATRSALVSMVVMALFMIFWGTGLMRWTIVGGTMLAFMIALTLLPSNVIRRYSSIWSDEFSVESAEALASSEARKDLMERALKYTIQRPLFGVGPGVFMDYDAIVTREEGKQRPRWQVAHNGYLEISSEAGIPAAIMAFLTMIGVLRGLVRVLRQARQSPGHEGVVRMVFCLTMSILSMMTFMMFLSHGFVFWPSLLLGLGASLVLAFHNAMMTAAPAMAPASPLAAWSPRAAMRPPAAVTSAGPWARKP